MHIVMNESMRVIYASAVAGAEPFDLPAPLRAIAEAGVILANDRLQLASRECISPPPTSFDDWDAERWTNKIHLDTPRPVGDSRWRGELLRNGLELAQRLLATALELPTLPTLPVQAVISLQSAEGDIDSEVDLAAGALHLYLVRAPDEDLSLTVHKFAQPVAVLTANASATNSPPRVSEPL